MKNVIVKLSLGEVTQTGDKIEVPLFENGRYIKTISATIGQDGKIHRDDSTDEEDLKLNLIPNIKLTNDREETFKITTQQTVIRIGNSVLLKHTPDITVELDKIFEKSKEVTLDLEYEQIDSNGQPAGNTTKRIYICGYEVREYYNTDSSKNDMIYIFNGVYNKTDELIAEYRYRTKGC